MIASEALSEQQDNSVAQDKAEEKEATKEKAEKNEEGLVPPPPPASQQEEKQSLDLDELANVSIIFRERVGEKLSEFSFVVDFLGPDAEESQRKLELHC